MLETMALTRILAALLLSFSLTTAQRVIHSTNFDTCMPDSQITASDLLVSVYENRTLSIFFNGTSTFAGNATVGYELYESGRQRLQRIFTPCGYDDFPDFCPVDEGAIGVNVMRQIDDRAVVVDFLFESERPDGEFRFHVNDSSTDEPVGCLRARLADRITGGNSTDMESTSGDEAGSGSKFSYPTWTLLMFVLRLHSRSAR